jgi:type IV pilus assembly protein PilA
MFQQMKKRIKNEKGLTLIELLAVIVILAIVAAIAIPAIGNIINNSRDKAILTESLNVIAGAKIAYTDGKCPTKTCNADALKDYVDGIDLTGISVTLGDTGWTFTGFDKLGTFSSDKSSYYLANGSTEKAIKDKIDK